MRSAGGLQTSSVATGRWCCCAGDLVSEWITGSWSHCGLHGFKFCSAFGLCGVILRALRMLLRGVQGLEAAHCARGAETRMESANAMPRAVLVEGGSVIQKSLYFTSKSAQYVSS